MLTPLTWISSLLTVTPFGLMRTSPGKIHHFRPNPAILTFTAGVRAFPYLAGLPSVTANSGSLLFSSGLCLGLPSDSPLPVTPLPLANASLTPHIRVFHPIVVYHAGRTRSRVGARDDGIGVRDDSIGTLRDDEKFSFSRERSELSFFLGSYGPRSGTGATQSYWHREAILAAEGDWRS